MYVEDSFAGREVNGPVMLCIHPHGACVGRIQSLLLQLMV